MPCFNSVPDDVWVAARVRALYTEPFLSRLTAAIGELKSLGIELPPVLKHWEKDAAEASTCTLKVNEQCDWLVGMPRYQMAYEDRNFAAALLCDSLWRILEAGGGVPATCRDWWMSHLTKDRIEPASVRPGSMRPDSALPPADFEQQYQRERELFLEIWVGGEQ